MKIAERKKENIEEERRCDTMEIQRRYKEDNKEIQRREEQYREEKE